MKLKKERSRKRKNYGKKKGRRKQHKATVTGHIRNVAYL